MMMCVMGQHDADNVKILLNQIMSKNSDSKIDPPPVCVCVCVCGARNVMERTS